MQTIFTGLYQLSTWATLKTDLVQSAASLVQSSPQSTFGNILKGLDTIDFDTQHDVRFNFRSSGTSSTKSHAITVGPFNAIG